MKYLLTYYVGFKAVESWTLNSQSLAYWKKNEFLSTGNYQLGKFKITEV